MQKFMDTRTLYLKLICRPFVLFNRYTFFRKQSRSISLCVRLTTFKILILLLILYCPRNSSANSNFPKCTNINNRTCFNFQIWAVKVNLPHSVPVWLGGGSWLLSSIWSLLLPLLPQSLESRPRKTRDPVVLKMERRIKYKKYCYNMTL